MKIEQLKVNNLKRHPIHKRLNLVRTEEELEGFNALEDSGAPEWDVFDEEGRYLGTVTMPARFAPRALEACPRRV